MAHALFFYRINISILYYKFIISYDNKYHMVGHKPLTTNLGHNPRTQTSDTNLGHKPRTTIHHPYINSSPIYQFVTHISIHHRFLGFNLHALSIQYSLYSILI